VGAPPHCPGSAPARARLWEQARAVALVLV
jgi:hypothetical protein